MTPNQVTLTRVAAAFAAVALFTLFGNSLAGDLAAVLLTIAAIALDGLDGYLARTRNLATPLGAQLDILGDRVVENLFFTFFAVSGLISLWVPVLFFVRGTLTDFLRSLAARAGRSGFSTNSMLETWWGRTLVASRSSRAAYAILKCICFCYLGLLLPAAHVTVPWLNAPVLRALALAGQFLVGATVAFCVLRAIPVIWEGRCYLTTPQQKSPARRRSGYAMTAPQQKIGAFFDVDGTLLPAPSLEWRFIGYLLERDEISSAQVARWLAHFAKTILRDPYDAIAANKFYLAGINTSLANDWERTLAPPSAHEDSLPLFAAALDRVAWHHTQGHRIFLITGTLVPLAQIVARRIAAQIQAPIEVEATQLEVTAREWHSHSWLCSETQWTGRLASQHMSNKAKADVLKALAKTHNIALSQSHAYGNATADIPMLESVGHPQAVNPRTRFAEIAKKRHWPILNWRVSATAAIPRAHTARFATNTSQ